MGKKICVLFLRNCGLKWNEPKIGKSRGGNEKKDLPLTSIVLIAERMSWSIHFLLRLNILYDWMSRELEKCILYWIA